MSPHPSADGPETRVFGDQSTALLDHLAEGVVITDRDGSHLHLNRRAREVMARMRAHHPPGRPVGEVEWGAVAADGSPLPTAEIPAEITRLTGREFDDEVIGLPLDTGAVHWYRTSTRCIDDGPAPHRVLTTFVDITRQREQAAELARMERIYRLSMHNSAIGKAVVDVATRKVIEANAALRDIVGRSEDDLYTMALYDYVHPEDVAIVQVPMAAMFRGEREHMRAAVRIRHGSGSTVWVDVSASLVRDDDGEPELLICQILDMTARHHAEEALIEAEERFRLAFDEAPIGIALFSPDGSILRVNRAACDMTGYAEGELLSKSFHDLAHPDDLETDVEIFGKMVAGAIRSYEMEQRLVRSDGSAAWIMLSAAVARDDDGAPRYVIAQVQDISERKRYEHELRHMADHDVLTGLANRRQLAADLARRLAEQRRHGHPFSLVLLDLDHFKYVNDSFGHHIGDRMLRAVADVLRKRLRESDLVARLGGDEFACVLPETTREAAAEVAGELITALRATRVEAPDRELRISASAGVVCAGPHEYPDEDSLLAAADLAMYEAKNRGRDRFAVTGERAESREPFGRNWSHRIRRALDENRFVLHYQPLVDLDDDGGEPARFEALIRLDDSDDHTLVLPATFLDIAERYGLMPAIDRWVAAQAIGDMAAGVLPADCVVSLNVSARSLVDERLPDLVQRLLTELGVAAARICFELPETIAIARGDEARRFARRMREIGCMLALDHVGSGLGSFSHIRHLPYDVVKIDGELVRAMTTSPQDRAIVEALVHLAHVTGRRTVAEFVGDHDTLELVREIGVDMAQGFHLGRPVPASELSRGCSSQ